MKVYSLIIFLIIFANITGCATIKTLQFTGGSRADGVVRLSYEYGLFDVPQVNWNQGLATARQVCRGWGYADARVFGGAVNTCRQFNGYGNCIDTVVTVPYQCTVPLNTQ